VDEARIVLDYLQALVWPALALTVLLFFRHELRDLVQRLSTVEGFGVKAALSASVRDAQRITGSTAEPRPRAELPTDFRTLRPRTFTEARDVAETFRSGNAVLMSLEDANDEQAKRLIDFSAGLIFQDRGTIERVSNKIFLLTPGMTSR
jgi:hypothetical protein